jgi:hypothetical protein
MSAVQPEVGGGVVGVAGVDEALLGSRDIRRYPRAGEVVLGSEVQGIEIELFSTATEGQCVIGKGDVVA